MLPGGIRVLGVFFADQQNSDSVLKSTIVDKCLNKIDAVSNVAKKQTSYLVMHLNKKTGAQVCLVTISSINKYSGGSNSEHWNSESIRIPNILKFRFRMFFF